MTDITPVPPQRGLDSLKGVGAKRLELLKNAGIDSISRLILTLPASYRDLTRDTPISEARPGDALCVTGRITAGPKTSWYNGLSRVSAMLQDMTGEIPLQFFNQPWIAEKLQQGSVITLFGRVSIDKRGRRVMNSPRVVTERIIQPVYPSLKGIPEKTLLNIIREALKEGPSVIPQTLPESVIQRYQLQNRISALQQAHFPQDQASLQKALRRLSFEGTLFFMTATSLLRGEKAKGLSIDKPDAAEAFFASLPFPPTGAQRRVVGEIARDMASGHAMNRLVQGDVGCGKTAVAFAAISLCAAAGHQSALMAPTEILARQHYESACSMLKPLGITCGLLLGGMKAAERRTALQKIRSGEWQCVIGTHALLSKGVEYADLALTIADEQHRFGVRQRAVLSSRAEVKPHALVMSATPIPRSLALVLWGDLDVSIVDELPGGRKPVKTRTVPEKKRAELYQFILDETARGHQAYIVCPLVEESESMDAAAAKEMFDYLSSGPLRTLKLGLTWGAQKAAEKEQTLAAFSAGEIQVLIATTVVEVGVNVPNATCMVIENASRFGLSQLHQLRGRVGRGAEESWCFLMAEKNERLATLCETNDGFKIAEKDLALRGPGDFLGTRQHGELMPGMCFTNDVLLIEQARECLRILQQGDEKDMAMVKEQAMILFNDRLNDIALN